MECVFHRAIKTQCSGSTKPREQGVFTCDAHAVYLGMDPEDWDTVNHVVVHNVFKEADDSQTEASSGGSSKPPWKR